MPHAFEHAHSSRGPSSLSQQFFVPESSSGLVNGQGLTLVGRRPGFGQRLSVPAIMHRPQALQHDSYGPPLQVSTAHQVGSGSSSAGVTPSSAVPVSSSSSSSSSSSPPPLNISGQRGSMHAPIAISSREIPAPVEGPLPSPGYSFGDAPTSLSSSSSSSSSIMRTGSQSSPALIPSFNSRRSLSGPAEGEDTEDDASANSSAYGSYTYSSRFGSLASVAGSESSFTSVSGGYYTSSENGTNGCNGSSVESSGFGGSGLTESAGPNGFDPDVRRPS